MYWASQLTGKKKHPTLVLEALANRELYIWNAFLWSSGYLNDIKVLDLSSTVGDILAGKFSHFISCVANGRTRTIPS